MTTAPPVKSGYISNGPGLLLNYLEWGNPDAPPVVLIIGLTGAAYNWRTTAEALQDRYRLISINLRGHGDSGPFLDRVANSPGDGRWRDWASDVHALIEELQLDKPVVMGHSLGARVAYCHAAYYPNDTRGIVVIDNGPGFPPPVALFVQDGFMRKRPMEFDSWDAALSWMAQVMRGSAEEIPEQVAKDRAPYLLRQLPDGKVTFKHDSLLRDEWVEKLPHRATMESWLWKEIAQVQCPMLLMKGATSPFETAETCEKMVDLTWGPARWVDIPQAGHMIMDDNLPAFLGEVEPFLEQSYRS